MKHLKTLLFALLGLWLFNSCDKENFTTDGNDKLEFSVDTLRFDTVFTELGSATRILKIYNPHADWIRISELRLENSPVGSFRLNIDGISSTRATDLEIAPHDSLYVFAEVTVDPDAPLSASPFVITGDIVCQTNGNEQRVVLEAWGQNANYLPNRFGAGGGVVLSCDMGELDWDDPKPYVIYGVLLIDSCQVNIPPGTRIYIHGGIQRADDGSYYNDGILYVGANGRIVVQGTHDRPVTIQGDRLEKEFDEVSGQWSRLHLLPGSTGNLIEHARLKNAINALVVDSAAQVTVKNTIISDAAGTGILALHGQVNAENCLIHDCGGNGVQVEWGGDYNFEYCTIASYGDMSAALRLSNALCLDSNCHDYLGNDLNARFTNCIISGSKNDELSLFDRSDASNTLVFDYAFDHCAVQVDKVLDSYPNFFDHCNSCEEVVYSSKLFKNVNKKDYSLDSLSVADGKALPLTNLPADLIGTLRDVSTPDMGALEKVD
jgi:hypothetical protein